MGFIKETFFYTKEELTLKGKRRLEFVDLAKGICILLVVFLHSGINSCVLLSMIRMPLYFLLSGLFFKDYSSKKTFLIKKTNNILVPLISFYYIAVIEVIILSLIAGEKSSGFIQWLSPSFLYSNDFVNYPLWFLMALFWVNVYYLILRSITNSEYQRGLLVFLTVLSLSIFPSRYFHFAYIDSAIIGLPFFYLGVIIRNTPIISVSEIPVVKTDVVVNSAITTSPLVTLLGGGYYADNVRDNYRYT